MTVSKNLALIQKLIYFTYHKLNRKSHQTSYKWLKERIAATPNLYLIQMLIKKCNNLVN